MKWEILKERKIYLQFKNTEKFGVSIVVHAYNPRYSEDRVHETLTWRPTQAKS
jgi:hypothetical protein